VTKFIFDTFKFCPNIIDKVIIKKKKIKVVFPIEFLGIRPVITNSLLFSGHKMFLTLKHITTVPTIHLNFNFNLPYITWF